MRNRVKMAVGVLLVAFLAFIAWKNLYHREPSYKGQTLSTWLWSHHNGGDPVEVTNAVLHIQTNAIPTLLDMVCRTESSSSFALADWWDRHVIQGHPRLSSWMLYLSWWKKRGTVLADEAALGFEILGSSGRSALPTLVQMYERNVALLAEAAPGHGRNMAVLAQSQIARSLIAVDPTQESAIPLFVRDATNSNETIRSVAIAALANVHCEPRLVVPALVTSLSDSNVFIRVVASQGLGSFGPDAQEAVPALMTASSDTNWLVRLRAGEALNRIGQIRR
jgi:hypothetical protein